jgi:O-acetyl-ADP-ribose deacetylase (regulator of RNase III)
MFRFEKSNILEAHVEVLVNTVNLQGVMGKGIALAFKKSFPVNYKLYKEACNTKQIDIGKIFVTENPSYAPQSVSQRLRRACPKYIINFPTKIEWRNPSKYEYIEKGLLSLVNWLKENKINSIAIPPLGCGNGKLDWAIVNPMIIKYLKPFENSLEIIFIEL